MHVLAQAIESVTEIPWLFSAAAARRASSVCIPATNREERRRPIEEASEKRRMEVFRDSAMNVLRRKGISGRGQPVILAQLRLRLQKAPKQNALRLHSRLHSLTGRLSENSKDN
jgi:hypothetical protein